MKAFYLALQERGLRVERLDAAPLPESTGNVLLIVGPLFQMYEHDDVEALENWIARGNTAVYFGPYEEAGRASAFDSSLQGALGFAVRGEDKFREAERGGRALTWRRYRETAGRPVRKLVWGVSGYHAGVARIALHADARVYGLAGGWDVDEYSTDVNALTVMLPLQVERWLQGRAGRRSMISRAIGAGRLVVFPNMSLISNRYVGMADNARLAENVIAAHLDRGAVLFDEYHHGFRPVAKVGARLPPAVAVLFAQAGLLALAFCLSRGRRLGPPLRTAARDASARIDFARSMGRLYDRAGSEAFAVRALYHALADRVGFHDPERHPAGEMDRRVAAHTGRPPEEVAEVLDRARRAAAGEPAQGGFVALARALMELYRGARRTG